MQGTVAAGCLGWLYSKPYQSLGTDSECAARSSAYREPSFGHAIIDFINGTHAQWYWNRNQVLPLDHLLTLLMSTSFSS